MDINSDFSSTCNGSNEVAFVKYLSNKSRLKIRGKAVGAHVAVKPPIKAREAIICGNAIEGSVRMCLKLKEMGILDKDGAEVIDAHENRGEVDEYANTDSDECRKAELPNESRRFT